MKEKIIIIGGKGSAVATAELIEDASNRYNAPYEFIGFCIDDESLGKSINGYPILCNRKELMNKYEKISDVKFLYLLYKPSCMRERVELLKNMMIPSHKFLNFIHPTAYVAKSVQIGVGNVISANCIINNNTLIGNHNAIFSNVVIEHDTNIANNNFFAASSVVGSEITIGTGNFFGLNCAIRENVTIGDFNIVGMCSGVLNNIENNETVVGLPSRRI